MVMIAASFSWFKERKKKLHSIIFTEKKLNDYHQNKMTWWEKIHQKMQFIHTPQPLKGLIRLHYKKYISSENAPFKEKYSM